MTDRRAQFTRNESEACVIGHEGKVIKRGIYKGRGIAVLTSGGDSQGAHLKIDLTLLHTCTYDNRNFKFQE